ncbi:hypothetical protein [Methylobacterium soli]|uniref:Phage tail tape measure protein domain-containing protein n=1 Tax=Methylobacterium soli TaxID=553447 RepID=A0A6L3STM2_9HYPH|nr:hypothetical protein [Methylobacterium soli]KAB1072549.1 hypothetical protein F6X53_28100 [Methylobacterium soli]GJE43828.1 hypothetical protein AEGHOMDF_3007 [Methylobacterium soli]
MSSDVYNIQTVLSIGGSLAPELAKILKNMNEVDKAAKAVERSIGRWSTPIDRTVTSMGRLSREMANVQRSTSQVEREVAKTTKAMAGLRAPATGMDREMAKWAAAIGRPLAEMRTMRSTTQGVASAARGVSRSIDSWANRINSAAAAMRRMSAAAANIHIPNIPRGVGGGAGTGGFGTGPSRRRAQSRQHRTHEGSHLSGALGVYGGLTTLEWLAEQGAGGVREDIRAKNAGLSPAEIAALSQRASELSRQYPSLSKLGVREQGRLLIPNVGDYGTASELLPEYMRGQVALQTAGGVDQGSKDMERMARFIDLIGRSRSAGDTRSLIDGFVRTRQLDAEAVSANDFVNAAQNAGSAGKALSVDMWSSVMPALFMQQKGSRTGTDVASAFQNTVLGRGTDESILAQYDEGWRTGTKWKVGKNGKRKLISDGSLVDEALYSSNFHEWNKKNVIPKMVAKGMLPEAYGRGDYRQDLTDAQRVAGTKYIAERFSNRRGASLHTMDILEIGQIEAIIKRLRAAAGTTDVLGDQTRDPMVAGKSVVTQGGNVGSALANPAIPDLVEQANRLSAALGGAADTLEKHPVAAQTGFGTGLAVGGGLTAAGMFGLMRMAAPLFANPIGLAIGAGATVTIAAVTIPWGKIYDAAPPGVKGALDWMGKGATMAAEAEGGALSGEIAANQARRNRGTAGLGLTPENIKAAQDRLNVTAGPGALASAQAAAAATGQAADELVRAAQRVHPPMLDAAKGFSDVAGAANGVPGALNQAARAISGFVGRILGGLNAGATAGPPALPGAKPPTGGASQSGGAPATPGKSAVIYRGGSTIASTPVTMTLNNRVLGRTVIQHVVAEADTRNGTQGFDDNTLKTPVGHSAPILA